MPRRVLYCLAYAWSASLFLAMAAALLLDTTWWGGLNWSVTNEYVVTSAEGAYCYWMSVPQYRPLHTWNFPSPRTMVFSTIHKGFARGQCTWKIWYFVMRQYGGPRDAARWPQPQPRFPSSSMTVGSRNTGRVVSGVIVGVWWDSWTLGKFYFWCTCKQFRRIFFFLYLAWSIKYSKITDVYEFNPSCHNVFHVSNLIEAFCLMD